MTSEEFELSVRLRAIEIMIEQVMAFQYVHAKLSAEQIDILVKNHLESLRTRSLVRTDDPVLSDVGSDTIRSHVERMTNNVLSMLSAVRPPKP